MISLIRLTKLPRLKRYLREVYEKGWPKEAVVLPITMPPLLPTLFALLTFIIMAPIIWIIDKLKHFDLIYVRSSLLALGILSINSLAKKTCVKLPAIAEDELLRGRKVLALVFKAADRFALARAGVVGCATPIMLKKLVKRRGVLPRGKIVFIPPGVDRLTIEKVKSEVQASRENKKGQRVGFIGSLSWWQGVNILVKAVARLKDLYDKPISLLIVGDGPQRKKVEKLCDELKVDCQITGFVGHDEALKHLASFDVLVVPSIRISTTESNVPIKVIEAWALGVPVITTKHEIYEYMGLRDKEDVVFCEPDPDDVAEKILMVLRDEGLRRKLSERGPRLAENFYYDKIVAGLVSAFRGSETYASA